MTSLPQNVEVWIQNLINLIDPYHIAEDLPKELYAKTFWEKPTYAEQYII